MFMENLYSKHYGKVHRCRRANKKKQTLQVKRDEDPMKK